MATIAGTRMFSVIKEEIPVVANELASSARATATTNVLESGAMGAMKVGEKELMNPVAVRRMAEMSVKEAGESSILGQHLSITRSALHPPPGSGNTTTTTTTTTTTASLLESLTNTSTTSMSTLSSEAIQAGKTTTGSGSRSIIAQALEKDAGVSIKEAISNAGQTGLEEVVEQLAETGKAIMKGGAAPIPKPSAGAGTGGGLL